MRGQSQLVIFVSSLGVRRCELRPSGRRAPIQLRVVARRPQRRTRAHLATPLSGYYSNFDMIGSKHEREQSSCPQFHTVLAH